MNTLTKFKIVKEYGIKFSKSKILNNNKLYKLLQKEYKYHNVEMILRCLEKDGFTIINSKQVDKQNLNSEVKIYHIEPNRYYKNDNDCYKKQIEYSGYLKHRCDNIKQIYKSYYAEKSREKVENKLSKPYYRENTDYSSI